MNKTGSARRPNLANYGDKEEEESEIDQTLWFHRKEAGARRRNQEQGEELRRH